MPLFGEVRLKPYFKLSHVPMYGKTNGSLHPAWETFNQSQNESRQIRAQSWLMRYAETIQNYVPLNTMIHTNKSHESFSLGIECRQVESRSNNELKNPTGNTAGDDKPFQNMPFLSEQTERNENITSKETYFMQYCCEHNSRTQDRNKQILHIFSLRWTIKYRWFCDVSTQWQRQGFMTKEYQRHWEWRNRNDEWQKLDKYQNFATSPRPAANANLRNVARKICDFDQFTINKISLSLDLCILGDSLFPTLTSHSNDWIALAEDIHL